MVHSALYYITFLLSLLKSERGNVNIFLDKQNMPLSLKNKRRKKREKRRERGGGKKEEKEGEGKKEGRSR